MNKIKKIVVKIGTKVIASREDGLDRSRIRDLVQQIADARDSGIKVIVVTSGAVGAGMGILALKKRPHDNIAALQATASIGQSFLMHTYAEYLKERRYAAGQILLTQDDLSDRKRYINIRHTIEALLDYNAVPIINENDTVATEEMKCGDNDRLSSLVADLCGADMLILLTDVDGLLDAHGRTISTVGSVTRDIAKLAGKSGCDMGTGGMVTKIEAARIAMDAGIGCVIANGRAKDIIKRILRGEMTGTYFTARKVDLLAKKRWIAFTPGTKGSVKVDTGAAQAILEKNRSLLASGILEVCGSFRSQDVISIRSNEGTEIAKGLTNYASAEIETIKGLRSDEFAKKLGYKGPDEVIHKDNLAVLKKIAP